MAILLNGVSEYVASYGTYAIVVAFLLYLYISLRRRRSKAEIIGWGIVLALFTIWIIYTQIEWKEEQEALMPPYGGNGWQLRSHHNVKKPPTQVVTPPGKK
jgi:hypothetical protein